MLNFSHDEEHVEYEKRNTRRAERFGWLFRDTCGVPNGVWLFFWIVVIGVVAPIVFGPPSLP